MRLRSLVLLTQFQSSPSMNGAEDVDSESYSKSSSHPRALLVRERERIHKLKVTTHGLMVLLTTPSAGQILNSSRAQGMLHGAPARGVRHGACNGGYSSIY
ncbi:hypothetical protein EVAR_13641_1 [Eumeta japonica]|uniref:Uncharacterized protein n=1 Tax=Eumeta variegata TaxID=151549 RepID=A0A4C1UTF8_EUMVA|nr:hypothetical protein EVAR_13641_1 [Eumeta japonica]